MHIALVSLFPEMFAAVTEHGVTGRAVSQGLVKMETFNPREFTADVHRTVDDRPYGGGPGMLMKTEPLRQAIARARQAVGGGAKVIYLSPQGRRFEHKTAVELSRLESMILVAGRYEGIDERLVQAEIDDELSIGDYVLSGGELAAMVVVDALIRQLPGVLGHSQSAAQDSFADGLLDCPHYTRPDIWQGRAVPDVLLGGNHEVIRRWRLKQALGKTRERRPDLLESKQLTSEEEELLAEYIRESESTTNTTTNG